MNDALTFRLYVGLLVAQLVLEGALLLAEARRTSGPRIHVISVVVKERAKRMNALPYVLGTLPPHLFPFWPSTSDPYLTWGYAGAIGLLPVVLAADLILRRRDWNTLPRWGRWLRWPWGWMVFGFLVGTFAFAQKTVQPWEGP